VLQRRMQAAVLYTRVSTDEQAEKGYSLQHQADHLQKYCARENLTVLRIFTDDHSAKSFDRPAFQEFLSWGKSNYRKVDYLLFSNWSRFSRNAADAYEMIARLRKWNIEPQAIDQPLDLSIPENKLMLAFFLAAPEVENDRRSLNVIAGRRRALKSGRWVTIAPIGYRNARDEALTPVILPSEKAQLVQEAFERVAIGMETRGAIYTDLQRRGLKVARSRFYKLLSDPVYMGKIFVPAYKDEPEEVVEGKHEGLVSVTLWYQAQQAMNQTNKRGPKVYQPREEFPLRGLLICPSCGRNLTASSSRGRHGGRYAYYHCVSSCGVRFNAKEVNGAFRRLLGEIRIKDEVRDLYRRILEEVVDENEGTRIKRRKVLEKASQDLKEKLIRLQDLLMDGKLDAEDYASMKARYTAELEAKRAEAEDLTKSAKEQAEELGFALNLLEQLPSIYEAVAVEGKQQIVGSIFPQKLVFSDGKYRTPRINPTVQAMCLNISELLCDFEPKKGHLFQMSFPVSPRGLEPLS
ncbi:MAG TPA: recombinase family protein, partial [Cytophagales bacterium]|nr:recombinase family protein [Cytophagales bacterium]